MNFTAAINADGSVAQCFECVPANTSRIGTGTYVVDFLRDVRIKGGYFRMVQVDTLSAGAITGGVSCTTADRIGIITSTTQRSGCPLALAFKVRVLTAVIVFVFQCWRIWLNW